MPFPIPDSILVFGINGGTRVFIPEGLREGKDPTRWIMTDACVVFVTCSQCGAKPMELCQFDSGKRGVTTHWVRRSAFGKINDRKISDLKALVPSSVRIASSLDLGSNDLSAEEHW